MARQKRRVGDPAQESIYEAFGDLPEFPRSLEFYARADGIREPSGSADDEYHRVCREHGVIPYHEVVFQNGEAEVIDYFGSVHLRERDLIKLRRPAVRNRIAEQALAGGRIHTAHLIFEEPDEIQQAFFTTLLGPLQERGYEFMYGSAHFGMAETARKGGRADLYLSERGIGLDFTAKKQHIADWFDAHF